MLRTVLCLNSMLLHTQYYIVVQCMLISESGNCLLLNVSIHLQGSAKADLCRKDWHQTGSFVVVSFYAKACDPEQCCVKANETTVSTTYTVCEVAYILCVTPVSLSRL